MSRNRYAPPRGHQRIVEFFDKGRQVKWVDIPEDSKEYLSHRKARALFGKEALLVESRESFRFGRDKVGYAYIASTKEIVANASFPFLTNPAVLFGQGRTSYTFYAVEEVPVERAQ